MSKREGEYVTLDELVDEVGVDAARFFLLARSHDTTVEVDLDLAAARARRTRLLRAVRACANRLDPRPRRPRSRGRCARGDRAGRAAACLRAGAAALPAELPARTGRRRGAPRPHRVASYALALAQSFTAFYRDCHVLGVEPRETESWRLALSLAARRTIACSLDLLGVSAPAQM